LFYAFAKAILRPFFFLAYNYRVTGRENMPENGAYIVCANHISALDPILIALALPNKMHFMAKAELFRNKLLAALLSWLGAFPIKRGEADIKSIKTSLKLLNEGKVLGLFPEGTRNKSDELMTEPGIAMLAIKAKVKVLPVAIISSYRFFRKSKIKIGKPIDLSEYYDMKLGSDEYTKISLGIMSRINELKKE